MGTNLQPRQHVRQEGDPTKTDGSDKVREVAW
jgi:hypothetical protein